MTKVVRLFLALTLVVGITLVGSGRPAPASAEDLAGVSDVSSDTDSDLPLELIAQEQEDGTCAYGRALVVYHASGAAKGSSGALTIQSGTDPLAAAGFAPSEVIDLSAADTVARSSGAASDGALSVQSQDGSPLASGSDVRVAIVEADCDTANLVAQLDALDFVECAQPDYTHEPCSTGPDDPLLDVQWGLVNDGAGVQYGSALAADDAATTAGTVKDNIVAVIDTGVDYDNPDLAGVMWTNPGDIAGLPGAAGTHGYDCYELDDDPMPGTARSSTHGTHCAGLIAAQTFNGRGIAGTALHTRIMALKIEDDAGVAGYSDSAIARAYSFLITAELGGEDVVAVSNSWHIGGYAPVLDYIVNQAGKAGVLSFFAAGNNGDDTITDGNYGATVGLESPYAVIVAASNVDNELAGFSNYDVTDVDLAAPGAGMLSTVRTSHGGDVPAYPYDPLYAVLTGTDPLYTRQLGSLVGAGGSPVEGATVTLMHLEDGSWVPAGAADAAHLSYAAQTIDDGLHLPGVEALQVTLGDVATLSDGDIRHYRIWVGWTDPNPFLGGTVVAGDHLAACDILRATSDPTMRVDAYLFVSGGVVSGATRASTTAASISVRDNSSHRDGTFEAIDPTAPTMTCRLVIVPSALSGNSVDCLATVAAIDTIRNRPAYSLMSGTSMATPMLAGCYAELASLFPDESTLELRGRLVGSTDLVTITTDASSSPSRGREKHTATDGRFTYRKAIDAAGGASTSAISANTWSVDCDTASGTITVHGYGLGDAALYVDDTSHSAPAALTAQTEDSLTFQADRALFDGARHRFDVVDASTGRTFDASYVVPEATAPQTQIVPLGPLPVEATSGSAGLVSATDRLFLTSLDGSYLYVCHDPAAATSQSAWTALAAPAQAFPGAFPADSSLRYAYHDGQLYAFRLVPGSGGGTGTANVYCATYDIATDTWSEARVIAALDDYAGSMTGRYPRACTVEGTVCYAFTYYVGLDKTAVCVLALEPGDDSFEKMPLPADLLANGDGLLGLYRSGQTLHALLAAHPDGADRDGILADLVWDGTTWSRSGVIAGTPAFTFEQADGLARGVEAVTGGGLFLVGPASWAGSGDAAVLDPESLTWTGLGSLLGSSTTHITVLDADMMAGCVYLIGLDDAALYATAPATTERLATTDVTLTALTADEDGRATGGTSGTPSGGMIAVEDWRGSASAAPALAVRMGDTATWTAVAAPGYTFVGWYDAGGGLVTRDTAFTARAEQTMSLTARFKADPAPAPAPAPSPSSDVPTGGPASQIPDTGDAALPGLVLILVLSAVGVLLVWGSRTHASMRVGSRDIWRR